MINELFRADVCPGSGYITSLSLQDDPYAMNWCAAGEEWGRVLYGRTDAAGHDRGEPERFYRETMDPVSVEAGDSGVTAVYTNGRLRVTVERSFTEKGRLRERYRIVNVTGRIAVICRDNFGIELPFSDRYTCADECMTRHCHTHLFCGGTSSWICALRMGPFGQSLGLVLTKGALAGYSQRDCHTNDRGVFIVEPETVFLAPGQEYVLEWELFIHAGKEDFLRRLGEYESQIGITAERYTLFSGEDIVFTARTFEGKVPRVTFSGSEVPAAAGNGTYTVTYTPQGTGEYSFTVAAGTARVTAKFLVKPPMAETLRKRLYFIAEHQQCRDEGSPLYGAYLIYDNESGSVYYDDMNTDHNACRERLNMPILMTRYLQEHPDAFLRASLDRYMEFMRREFYEETTGEVYNSIGKLQDALRLYNAPGVMLLFSEMYLLTREERYIDQMLLLAKRYYEIGGEKCYANGIAVDRVMRAFRLSGRAEDGERMLAYFRRHADNIILNGLSYPKHEVNYEQTIVTPAVTILSEMGLWSGEREKYLAEAKKHIACLERFSGFQPDYRLNGIALRYWDDYWFGKRGCFGDTLPHHLSSLTARAYIAYYRLSGEKKYLDAAENCLRNCMCLVDDDGRGHAAYVYPRTVNGKKGAFFDEWANDQDIFFYHALNGADLIGAFGI